MGHRRCRSRQALCLGFLWNRARVSGRVEGRRHRLRGVSAALCPWSFIEGVGPWLACRETG